MTEPTDNDAPVTEETPPPAPPKGGIEGAEITDGAQPLPPEALDPWPVKERVVVELKHFGDGEPDWRSEEVGAPHMKGFLFDASDE